MILSSVLQCIALGNQNLRFSCFYALNIFFEHIPFAVFDQIKCWCHSELCEILIVPIFDHKKYMTAVFSQMISEIPHFSGDCATAVSSSLLSVLPARTIHDRSTCLTNPPKTFRSCALPQLFHKLSSISINTLYTVCLTFPIILN